MLRCSGTIGCYERPVLSPKPFFQRIVLNIFYGAMDVRGCVQENFPQTLRPHGGHSPPSRFAMGKRMKVGGNKSTGRRAFEQIHDLLDMKVVPSDNQMNVPRQYRTGIDDIS